jgi:glycosyltransferase involved in cell wall biosynthesis
VIRVGVNLLFLVPGVVGGTEEYAVRLLGAWDAERGSASTEGIELVVFALPAFGRAHPDLAGRFEMHTAPVSGASKPLRVIAESTWLPLAAARARVGLVHHVGDRIPVVGLVPSVMTLHDLQPLDLPQNFSTTKRRFLGWSIPRSLRRARAVMTVSEHVRRSAILRGADPRTASVVSAPAPAPARAPAPTDLPSELLARLDRGAPFFVYPAIAYPHKNHATLVRAFALAVQRHPDALLILTGGPARNDTGALARLIDELDLTTQIVALGRVERPTLDWLLERARALTFPSSYEGFGLPVVEAMAFGCPVIAANAAALPEIVGDAGVLVPPHDVDAWAQALVDRLEDCPPRDELAQLGYARLARWTGPDMVTALATAYRAALAGPDRPARQDSP